ncbi:hypothetical protein HELRODRAFT_189105 [Helobdella robusta]|uniref:SAM domain-containing protein n=1 Tax=Helobdella robusta TaxID=6412 RepID=T1FQN6_HELRO|nr:hypothetical protein HELRODRAFT_189105 [Helobdella robusta]ESN96093.1 hypothetical protein HELRODRAFT_189105 [Helobdella robusta]
MSDLAAFWFKFFIDAGIPASDAGSYAVSFTENRIYSHMIMDLTKENLKELGVNALGDTIAILKHIEMFKLQEAKNKVLQGSEFIKSQNVLMATRLSANIAPTTITPTSKIASSHITTTTAAEYFQHPLHIINSNKAIPQNHQQQQHPQLQQPQLQQPQLQQPQVQQPQVQQQQSNPLNKILSVKQNLKQQQHHHHQQSLTTITTTTPTVTTDTNSLNSNNAINISSNEHKITQARLTKTNMIKDKTKAVTPTMNSTKINNSANISNNNKSSSSSSNKTKTADTPSKHIHNFLDDLKNINKEDGKKLSSKNGSTTTTTASSNSLGSVFSRLGKSMSDSKNKSEIKTYKSPIVEDIEREHPGIFSRLGCRNLRPTQTSSPATSNKNMNCTKSNDNNNNDDDDDDDVGEDDENDYDEGDNEEEENYHIYERDDENFGEGDEDDENFVSDDEDKDYIIMSAINQSRSHNNQSATSQPLTISAGVLSSNSVLPARHRPPSHGFFSPQTQNVNTDNVVKGSLASRLGKKVSESVVKAKVLNAKNENNGGGDIAEALAIVRKKTDHSSPLNRLVKAELKTIEIEKKPKKTKLVAVSEGIFQKAVSSFTKLNRNTSNVTGGRATTGDSNNISTAASVNNNTQRCSNVVAKVDNFGKTPILSRLGKRTITMPLDVVSTKKSAREGMVSGVFARLGQKN